MTMRRVEIPNQMILKRGLEELSEEYQHYWQMAGQAENNKFTGMSKTHSFEENKFFRAISFIGYVVLSFGILYLLAILMHYMMEE